MPERAAAHSTSKPRVVYWNNQPTPYLVARLNAVVERDEVELEVWFDEMRQSDRSWDVSPEAWRFRWRLVPPGLRGMRLPIGMLRESRPDLLICNYDRLNMILGATAGRLLASRVALRALPSYPAQSGESLLRDLAWRYVFRIVDGAKTPGGDGRRFCQKLGLSTGRCWAVKQSIDVEMYGSARRAGRVQGGGIRFAVVSRMIRSKGIDEVLDAWRISYDALLDAHLLLAGDGPDEGRLRRKSEGLFNVTWLGFKQPAELAAVYAAADVLVFPTLGDPNGLVVEEAMAAGLPVLSSDAAGDIRQRVPEGEAGWVVKAGDVSALANALKKVATMSPSDLERIGASNRTRASEFVPDNYARDFSAFVQGVLSMPRRRNVLSALARLVALVLTVSDRLVHRENGTSGSPSPSGEN